MALLILLYQDDFENNNPLRSHRGEGKVGGAYVVLPCLPPNMASRTENIFPITLYTSSDLNCVPLRKMFNKAVTELLFLETEGIRFRTKSGPIQIYFSLAGVIGDNLAIHTILGFVKSFSANFPCRFCLINSKDITSIFKESSCQMRTKENYMEHLIKREPSGTGICGLSVLNDFKSASAIDVMTVHVMQDILEGIWE